MSNQSIRMHQTSDGRVMRICDMTDQHLLNAIEMQERIARQGLKLMNHPQKGVRIIGQEVLDHYRHDWYVQEALRRKLPGFLNRKETIAYNAYMSGWAQAMECAFPDVGPCFGRPACAEDGAIQYVRELGSDYGSQ